MAYLLLLPNPATCLHIPKSVSGVLSHSIYLVIPPYSIRRHYRPQIVPSSSNIRPSSGASITNPVLASTISTSSSGVIRISSIPEGFLTVTKSHLSVISGSPDAITSISTSLCFFASFLATDPNGTILLTLNLFRLICSGGRLVVGDVSETHTSVLNHTYRTLPSDAQLNATTPSGFRIAVDYLNLISDIKRRIHMISPERDPDPVAPGFVRDMDV